MGDLEVLPAAVMTAVLEKLDLTELFAVALTCRQLRTCVVGDVIPRLPLIHLLRDKCLSEEDLAFLLANNATVQSLKLDCSKLEDDTAIEYLIKPSLHELTLYHCEKLSSDLLVKIGQKCKSLRSLELELGWQDDRPCYLACFKGSYSDGLVRLLEGCSMLESLSLSFAGSCFNAEALAAIPALRSGSLQSLEIGFLAERDAKHLLEVGTDRFGNVPSASIRPQTEYSNLQKLYLSLDRISDALVTTVSRRLPTLLDLDLRDEPTEEPLLPFDLTNTGVQQVGGCRLLRRLSLVRKQDSFPAYFKRVSDLGIFLMAESCVNLHSIRLGGFGRITDAGCRALLHTSTKLQSFEVLHMSQMTDLAFHDLSVTSLSLEYVGLSSCSLLSDDAVASLTLCRGLRVLNVNGCRSIGDGGLKAIAGLSHLQTLSLNGTDVTDHGLGALGKSSSPLVSLSLRACQRVSEKGIFVLLSGALVETLDTLDLSANSFFTDDVVRTVVRSGVKLSEFWLRDCILVTDLSVVLLAESTCGETLRVLDFWGCKAVRLNSVKWLKKPHFPRLRWLGVAWTFSLQVVRHLKTTRPSLRIRRDGAEASDRLSEGFVAKCGEEFVDELEQWLEENYDA